MGNDAGQIRFYDRDLKLLYIVPSRETDNVDPIGNISFNLIPRNIKIIDPVFDTRKYNFIELISILIEKVF